MSGPPFRPPQAAARTGRFVIPQPPDPALIDAAVQDALDTWGREPTQLLQVLRHAQEPLGYLPPAALERIAAELAVPIARVRGVMAFYSFLYPESPGTYRVLFSDNVTDRMHGSRDRLREMCERLWVEPGKVSEDGLVSIDRTSCDRPVRPRAVAAGERPPDPRRGRRACRATLRPDPRARAAR